MFGISTYSPYDGLVGLTAVGQFLRGEDDGRNPTLDDYVDHVEHAVDVVGPAHVGVGSTSSNTRDCTSRMRNGSGSPI